MTHSLHRVGSREDLESDWVILLCPTIGVNSTDNREQFLKFYELCIANNAVTMGEGHVGSDIINGGRKQLMEALHQDSICGEATFNTEKDVANMLRDLKKADLGISVVVSGLIDKVDHICREVGTTHHTVSNSYGIWGDTSKLPREPILAIVTMCGHGLVSSFLAEEMVEKIKSGRTTAKKAAWEMAKDCTCGIFNPDRAERLLQALADSER